MSKREFFGLTFWVAGYNLAVALSAYFLGLGISLALISVRYMLLGIPRVFEIWRLLVVGREQVARSARPERQWPNWHWVISGLIYAGVTAVVLLQFNIRLIDVIRWQ